MRSKIGECLVKAGVITDGDLQRALAERANRQEPVGAVLVRLRLATESQIAQALASQLGFPYVCLPDRPIDPSVVRTIPKNVAVERVVLALELEDDLLTIAMADPLQFSVVQALERHTCFRIEPVVAPRAEIIEAIERWYDDPAVSVRARGLADALVDDAASGSIVEIVDRALQFATEKDASEIHVEPLEREVLVRFRIDGLLGSTLRLPKNVQDAVGERLKAMAGMDASETRLPQDGRLRLSSANRILDFHVSTLRTAWGEKLVLRKLEARRRVPAPEELGMSAVALGQLRQWIRRDRGLILSVGPTGSGRSTMAWSALACRQSEQMNIGAVEESFDYAIPGVIETRVSDQLPSTFANAVRSTLRQNPDVILVGEIPDVETAGLVVTAARKRLVVSTLGADDAVSAMEALDGLGVDRATIARMLVGVVACRLVRRLCARCRQPYSPTVETLRALNISDDADTSSTVFCRPVGCDDCNHTGYRGRVGLYEAMRVSDRLKRLIAANAPAEQLRDAAIAGRMVVLAEDGLAKVKAGITTAEELLRVVDDIGYPRPLCTECGAAVSVDFLACPNCGAHLGGACPHCGRALQPAWTFCPYCARSAATRPPTARRPRRAGKVAQFKK